MCYLLLFMKRKLFKAIVSCDFIINYIFIGAELWLMEWEIVVLSAHKVQWLLKQLSENNVNSSLLPRGICFGDYKQHSGMLVNTFLSS